MANEREPNFEHEANPAQVTKDDEKKRKTKMQKYNMKNEEVCMHVLCPLPACRVSFISQMDRNGYIILLIAVFVDAVGPRSLSLSLSRCLSHTPALLSIIHSVF